MNNLEFKVYNNPEERIEVGPPTQAAYEEVIAECASLRLFKVNHYGEGYYQETDPVIAMQGLYHDLKRKFIRIEQVMRQGELILEDGQPLREALMDLEGYCTMGVQLHDQFFPKEGLKFELPKLDQLAIYSPDPEKVMKMLSLIFNKNLTWHSDMACAHGEVYGEKVDNVGNLNFNYEVAGIEFEVLKYEQGDNWLNHDKVQQGLSHVGVHVPDLESWKFHMDQLGFEIAQELETDSHSNPVIDGKSRYKYVIYNTVDAIGFYLKLIERIPHLS